jgi:hypothetical protein
MLSYESSGSLTKVHSLNKAKYIDKGVFQNQSLEGKIWIDSCIKLGFDYNGLNYDDENEGWPFQNCTNITEVVLSKDLDKIPDMCFSGCQSLKKVHNLNKVKRIGNEAFCSSENSLGCPLEGELWIDSCTDLLDYVFNSCQNLTKVILSPQLENVGLNCFSDCPNLKEVRNLDKIKSIGEFSFYNTGLTGHIYLNSCLELYEGAFAECPNLTDISVPKALYESIKDNLTNYASESVNWIPSL